MHDIINGNSTNQITLIIENNSSSDYTCTIMPVIGYENSDEYIPPSGYTLIKDIYRYELTGDPNKPKLTNGMIPIMYYNNKWVKADTENINGEYQWYDYYSKKWANAVLVTSDSRNTYIASSAGTEISEEDILAYYVWIPRYKYKVWNINKIINTDSYNAFTNGIDIVFEKGTETTGTVECNYDFSVTEGNNLSEVCTGTNGDYYTHPAFTLGDDELEGIWVGKFEMASENPSATNGGANVTNLTVRVKPNIVSWRGNGITGFYKVVYDMQKENNIYGLSTDRSLVDSHLIKNLEWGAVAYFTHSKYGRCTNNKCEEVSKNNSSDYITGNSGDTIYDNPAAPSITNSYETTLGQKASTTKNIYGIYDMCGGAIEYVMANMSNTAGSYAYYQGSGGTSYTYQGNEKYIDTYSYGTKKSIQSAFNRSRLGDAIGEIIKQNTSSNSWGWNSDYIINLSGTTPFLVRGSAASGTNTNVGIFYSSLVNGGYSSNLSSRCTLSIM